jgi:hypothetical protein
MVTFGGYPLAHVLDIQIQETRVLNDRLIPSATVGHRSDQAAGGRIFSVQGEIRDDPDYMLRLEELRIRADNVARDLDLQDDSDVINAKLGTVEVTWTAENGLDWPSYVATFYETS